MWIKGKPAWFRCARFNRLSSCNPCDRHVLYDWPHLEPSDPGGGRGVAEQVEFPEVKGALLKFLRVLSPGWNISLFHYRQSGNRSSTILLGLQVPRLPPPPPPPSLLTIARQHLHSLCAQSCAQLRMPVMYLPLQVPLGVCCRQEVVCIRA